ncbi:MAG: response regulator [Anaerolineae bacterium]|nr:response regulator [Anaerolineae bacterium]
MAMNKLKVLVIDDSPQIREFVTEYILEPNGFEADIATNGAEGLEKVLASAPDLVLMDYEMPKMTGIEVLRNLRAKGSKVPVILMTSHGSEQVAIEVFRLGAKDYLIKPFAAQEMLETIEDVLAVTRLRREKEALTQRILQANQQLEQHIRELNTLYQVGKSITALMQPNKMLERIVDAVLFVTQSQECSLVLVDSQTGKVNGCLRKQRSANGSQIVQSDHNVPAQLALIEEGCEDIQRKLAETILSVPLQVGQQVIGTLSISKQITGQFTTHDDRLLRMLADYAAIAIHNMQLMRQLHLTKEREKQQIRGMFERYVAPTVVEQILAQPGKVELGGTRQAVTVLFADVRGFSSFSSQTSPEILVELLNQYMRVAAEAVLAQEGTLDKFMGDAVMAFFNAPLPQTDHPVRAVRAAWKLCRLVERLHRNLPPEHRLYFGVGVGIGEAVVGNVGTAQMMNYTVIGDSVNKVKRLQEQAQGGQILISQETYYLVQDCVKAQPIGSMRLKGQSQAEPVYEIVGLL